MTAAEDLGRIDWQLVLRVVLGAALLAPVLYLLHWLRQKQCPAPFVDSKTSSKRLEEPESTLPFFKNTLDFSRHEAHIHDWISSQCERFQGRPWKFKILGSPPAIVFSDPRAFEDILKTQFWRFEKGADIHEVLYDFIGDGIFSVDGEQWLRQRKTASHLFTLRELRDTMMTVIQQHTTRLCKLLDKYADEDTQFDLFQLFNRFTMSAFCEIGFGVDMDCLEPKEGNQHAFPVAFDRVQQVTQLRLVRPRWFWKLQRLLNVGVERTLRSDMQVVNEMVLQIISDSLQQQQNSSKDQKKTIVSLFLDKCVEFPGQSKVDSKFLRDVVLNFLLAGRDTTAQTMSWLSLCLSEHPHVETKLRQELADNLSPESTRVVKLDQVQSLVYLDAVIHETLRLYPPVSFNQKMAVHDSVLSDGTLVPKGTNAAFPSYALGRMTSVWGDDAKQFKPERWIDPETGTVRKESSFKFIAFHAGPRQCLGKNLAMMEMKIVLATLLLHFQFQVEKRAEGEVKYNNSLTLPMKTPLRTRVTKSFTL